MHKHLFRLIAVGLLAALGLTLFIHLLATSDNSKGGAMGVDADTQRGFFVFRPTLEVGDQFELNWEWAMGGFRPVFSGGDFYVVEGDAAFPFEPTDHKVLYHGRDTGTSCCGPSSTVELERKPGQGELSLVWVLEYEPGWRPTGSQTTTDLLGQPMASDTTAQERELRYIRAFIGQAQDGRSGPFELIRIAHASTYARHPAFIVVESLFAVAGVVFWALGLSRMPPLPATGDASRMAGLVQRGREYLRAQLRLHLLVGPLLLMVVAFGADALDNGGFGFYDPSGFYAGWIAAAFIGLWLLAVAVWVLGLVRVLRSLRHYNKTPGPELGVPVA